MDEEIIKLSGTIEGIIYKNDENGYTVCDMEVSDELITAVGIMPFVSIGEEVNVSGKWIYHKNFGRQFQVSLIEKKMPSEKTSMLRYLSAGNIKGIGEATAKKIVDLFGDDTFSVIENEPLRLTEIKGISKKKAEDICIQFQKQFGIRQLIIFLQPYNIRPSSVMKIYKKLGPGAIDLIKMNPYILCDNNFSINFKTCDEIALDMDFEGDEKFRVMAAIKYVLSHNILNGHTFVPKNKLFVIVKDMTEIDEILFEDAFDKLIKDCEIYCTFTKYSDESVYIAKVFYTESYIAKKLIEMKSSNYGIIDEIDELIYDIEKEDNISYSESQKTAIKNAYINKAFVLTGGPGTGKTTVLNGIISLYKKLDMKILLAAPTGRAAKRMTEITGEDSKTVHKLLEMDYNEDENLTSFARNEQNPLDCDVLIVDEFSMMDIYLFEALLKALPQRARLFMVGDSNQLPSVGAGNVFRDIVESGVIETVVLDKIYRQSEESKIVLNAHRILKGEYPDLKDKKSDFFFMKCLDDERLCQTVASLCSERLTKTYNYNKFDDIQVICPSKKSLTGTYNLNRVLQNVLNPKNQDKKEKEFRDIIFREGDKVMQIKNNYDIIWKKDTGEDGKGIYNGDIGIILEINFNARQFSVRYDDKTAFYEFESFEEIEHAYAITVHKSQGSEFPCVVIPILRGPSILFYRNLLYTAITRAKENVIIIGNEQLVKNMVDNNKNIKRYTGLESFLETLSFENV